VTRLRASRDGVASPTRRQFLRTTTAAGLVLAFDLRPLSAISPTTAADEAFEPNAHLRVGSDGTVTLWVTKLEMGQGVRTLLPMILAEELEADWTRVRIEQASPGPRFKGIELHTSGSDSSSAAYPTAACGRRRARRCWWPRQPLPGWSTLIVPRGAESVVHLPTGRRQDWPAGRRRRATASTDPARAEGSIRVHAAGKPMKRVDGPAIVTGRAEYGLDVRVPGMLFASIERAPTLGGTLVRFDATAALQVPGVRHVAAVTSGILPGVAVVAEDNWAALRGREALSITWGTRPGPAFDSDRFLSELPAACERATFKVRHEGDARAAMDRAARRLEATYVFPFQAHAPMEPMNCTAHVQAGRAEVWAPTQTDVRTLAQVAKVTGLPDTAITLHCIMMGGGFGRRLFADYAAEAAELSKAIDRPVQVT
jgi:isoquinoline 1-oxidoreductase beta subunit